MKSVILPLIPCIAMFCSATLSAQIALTSNLDYAQDFNKAEFTADFNAADDGTPLAWNGTTSSTDWSNDSTFFGWYRQVKVGSNTNALDKDFIGELNAGTTRFGLSANWDPTETTNTYDSALGVVMDGNAVNQVSFGVLFEVSSGLEVTSVDVSYKGEQWFRANIGGTLNFQYKIVNDATDFSINTETGWTDVDTLDFSALKINSNSKLDGNAGANSSLLSDTITLSASEGQYVAFRYQYSSVSSNSQAGLFVDDFAASFATIAVPEPSAFALLAGATTLAMVILRRRR